MTHTERLSAALRELSEEFARNSTWSFFRFAKENDLSPPHLGILMRLARGDGRGIARIGGELSMTGAAASQMVDRLVQQGLVERREDPEDRRSKRLGLTALGETKVRECREARELWLEALASRLSPDEAGAVIEAIGILATRMRELESPHAHRDCGAGREGDER